MSSVTCFSSKMNLYLQKIANITNYENCFNGNSKIENKLEEAKLALLNGANELDFVCDYNLFKMGEYDIFDKSILECTINQITCTKFKK